MDCHRVAVGVAQHEGAPERSVEALGEDRHVLFVERGGVLEVADLQGDEVGPVAVLIVLPPFVVKDLTKTTMSRS